MKILKTFWFVPSVVLLLVIAMWASVFLSLFPLPYYLSKVVPFALLFNVVFMVYLLVTKNIMVLLKASPVLFIGFALWYLWYMQTA